MLRIAQTRLAWRAAGARMRPSPSRGPVAIALFATVSIAATGCGGSAISPEVARAANQGIYGTPGPMSGPSENPGIGVPGAQETAPGGPGGSPTASIPGNGNGSIPGSSTGPVSNHPPSVTAGSCAGFKNQRGITSSTITLGNGSDISGPVPGLFTSAQQATKAYVAYFNSTSSICGRKLALKSYDTRTDSGADQLAYTSMCTDTFAAVGSMSAFDSGGAGAAQACGLPDIRTASTTKERNACSTCFGAQSLGTREFTNVADFYTKYYPAATKKAAFLYLNTGAAVENAKTVIAVNTKRGFKYAYTAAIDIADFNYGPYVQQMKSKGVELVQFIGAYQQTVRLAQAMQSNDFKPQVFAADPSVYDPGYVQQGGSAVEGTTIFVTFEPLEDPVPEQTLYRRWLQQVAPGAQPSFFGLFAWSAAKLFVEEALALGAKLSRQSLVAKTRTVSGWTANGLHAPMSVGAKHPTACVRMLELKAGKWIPLHGARFVCYGYSKA